ncbi:hypothetical protein P154DRAFT_573763 [Amniculicola lignicola CBS 123094]|uniref:Uncharacterized protein n=1 Tax=Amniculicola lignicola CBS 123094 TaxID=1392246 RepID=A0A6A5WM72_9PLEO|nr:hypothetical protein P154DRAFT_573763 [Amniculicola lignicola CBS 123094]
MSPPDGFNQQGQQGAYPPYNPNQVPPSPPSRAVIPPNHYQADSAQPRQAASSMNGYGNPAQIYVWKGTQTELSWPPMQSVPRDWSFQSQQARDVVDRFGGPEMPQQGDRETERNNAEYYRQQFQNTQADAQPDAQPGGRLTEAALRAQGNRIGSNEGGGIGRWWNEEQREMVWNGVGWVRRNRNGGQ